MNFSQLARRASKFTVDNSPLILTAFGVAGTVTTAYLTGRASFKAAEILINETTKFNSNTVVENTYRDEDEQLPVEPLHLKTALNLVWKLYIPPVLAGAATITAIVGANQIGARRSAALAAAFTLSERAFDEYKEKVKERIGEHKEQGVRDDIAQDRVNRNPLGEREVIFATGSGDVICYEQFCDRYFKSTHEDIKRAVNNTNYMINNNGHASLSDFYDHLGLPRTSHSDEVGWTHQKLMDVTFTTTLSDKMEPVLAFDYTVVPVRDYFRFL